MKIGLISDTHGFFDPTLKKYFSDCDEIWHAGDIGEDVLNHLTAITTTRAIFGNADHRDIQQNLPEDLWFSCEGLVVWITHIGGSPPRYNPRTKSILSKRKPDIFICGHSHILKVVKDPVYAMLYINPGAAGHHGFHHIRTVIRFEISASQVKNMEVIELGKRGTLL